MTAMPAVAPTSPLAVQSAGKPGGLARWLRGHRGAMAIAAILAFAGPLTFFVGALSVMWKPTTAVVVRIALWWALYGLALWCLLLVVGYACQRLARYRRWYIDSAIWLSGACLAAGLANALTAGRATILVAQGLVYSSWTMHVHGFAISLIMALVYFAHLNSSRGRELAAARLSKAQAAQRDARHRIVQARLQELRARVDPRMLFELLETVRRLYERDAAAAERFLDEMIEFLRAALARLRFAQSSLGREIEIAKAYLRLRALAGATELGLTVAVALEAAHTRFPPGVLLPLLDSVDGDTANPCRLAATRSGDSCRVVLTLGAAPTAQSVARVRSLLSELYQTAGILRVEGTPDAVKVIVSVPHELA